MLGTCSPVSTADTLEDKPIRDGRMKAINYWIGLTTAILVFGFAYVWMFVPEKKKEIQDWWYGMTIDCPQLHSEVSNHQRCKISDDCELARSESIRAEKLEAQYGRYCGNL
jgi:hypothetical protein